MENLIDAFVRKAESILGPLTPIQKRSMHGLILEIFDKGHELGQWYRYGPVGEKTWTDDYDEEDEED
jgi:hypothetical protein